jgi:hypothetical protein
MKKYNKYKSKYNDLKNITIGKINTFEGSGGTNAIDILYNNKLIGRVICSPFCLYAKYNGYHINVKEFIEKLVYKMWINKKY